MRQPLLLPATMSRLQLDIPEQMKQQLKILAIKRKTTMSEIVEAALEAYLPQLEAEVKN